MQTEKVCGSCGKSKPLDAFISKNNVRKCCEVCRRGPRPLKMRETHRERLRRQARQYRYERPFHVLCSGHKKRCRRLGVPFDLTPDYLESIYPKDGKCPILGIDMILGGTIDDNRQHYASLDRIEPEKGYTQGNVVWVSYRGNQLRSNATVDELQAVIRYILSRDR